MRTGRAFELDDLTLLFELDLAEPADKSDIEAIEGILARLRAANDMVPDDSRWSPVRPALRLVPRASS
jgi:hypothetical protein